MDNQASDTTTAELTSDELEAVSGGANAGYTVFYDVGYWIGSAINWIGDAATSIGDAYTRGLEQSNGGNLAY